MEHTVHPSFHVKLGEIKKKNPGAEILIFLKVTRLILGMNRIIYLVRELRNSTVETNRVFIFPNYNLG